MDLFSNQAGAVVAAPGPGIPMAMFLQNWPGYAPMKAIVTGTSVQNESGALFSHSLRDFIYAYGFGDRIAPLNLSGLAFAHACQRMDETIYNPFNGRTAFLPNYHGLEYVQAYYNAFRFSSIGAPVTIVLGLSTVFFGFLLNCNLELRDPEQRIFNFSFAFKALPQVNLIDMLG